MALKLEQMMSEVRNPSHIETDKPVQFNGTLTVAGSISVPGISVTSFGTSAIAGGSVVINAARGRITSGALTTASWGVEAFDLVNSNIALNSEIFFSTYSGTNTLGIPHVLGSKTVTAGSTTVYLANSGTIALNGTVFINFLVVN